MSCDFSKLTFLYSIPVRLIRVNFVEEHLFKTPYIGENFTCLPCTISWGFAKTFLKKNNKPAQKQKTALQA